MTQTTPGGSPFPYRLVFNSSLTQALNAEAISWDGVTEFSDLASPQALSVAALGEDFSEVDLASTPEPNFPGALGFVFALAALSQTWKRSAQN
ncbi:MAG: hypothetical protein HC890_13215 [Chloroflexaceae bacterium]|nr:hypothetical protein [Chloroflexaceae bacterium]